MRLSDLTKGGGTAAQRQVPDLDITGLTADSRDVRPGFLFAALPGEKEDGQAYIDDAIAKGAIAILAPPTLCAQHLDDGIALVTDPMPRRRLALLAAQFHQGQPDTIAAVTGTNGKTSVTHFVHQLWQWLGHRSAALGTLGVMASNRKPCTGLTTPDPVRLHECLADLKQDGVNHLAIEASSHGLDQHRLDGVNIAAAAFTNLSRDHLDYHKTMTAYLDSKLRLFSELLRQSGTAIVDAGSEQYEKITAIVRDRGLVVLTYGHEDGDIHCTKAILRGDTWSLNIQAFGTAYKTDFALPGAYQINNALCALAITVACGAAPHTVVPLLSRLACVPGRMQVVGQRSNGATVIIDYAHTPDALVSSLQAARPYATNKLIIVFGCGGDRDLGKRVEMGKAAARCADTVIVTDDNPRSEDPAAIRAQAMKGCPKAVEIGDRHEAIRVGVAMLQDGDLLMIAGKGHEQGQIIGGETFPFNDVTVARAAITAQNGAAA